MAEDDSAVERSPADLRAEFRETCARITGNVNDLEARARTQVGAVADSRRVANVLKGSGVKPLLVAGAAAGFIAMRWWGRDLCSRGSRDVESAERVRRERNPS